MDALALIEIGGWSPAMVVLDAMEKAANVRLLQTELNDAPGVCNETIRGYADIEAARKPPKRRQGHADTGHRPCDREPAENSRAAL